jgi:PAS domain S-box-containing protein
VRSSGEIDEEDGSGEDAAPLSLMSLLREAMSPPQEPPAIRALRKRLVDAIMATFAIVGLLPILLVTGMAIVRGQWLWAALFSCFYVAIVASVVFAKQLPHHGKVAIVLVSSVGFAVTALARLGLSGAGVQLLLAGAVVAFVLLGFRRGVLFMVGSLVIIAAAGVVIVTGIVPIPESELLTSFRPWSWLVAATAFTATTVIMLVGPQLLLNRLARSLAEQAKQAQALEDSERRFRELAELLPETVFETDLSLRFVFVNRNGLETMGYDEDFDVHALSVMDILTPEDLERGMGVVQRELQGEKMEAQEYTVVRKDGSTLPALVKTNVIVRSGQPVGLRGVMFDVTKQKELERELVQASKMQAVGTLAGGIAHDFNNLLTGIQGHATLARRAKTPARAEEHLDTIHACVKSAADLTSQLLGFARGGRYHVEPTDLNELIGRAVVLFSRTHRQVRIDLELASAPVVCRVDRGQIEQVLLNLLVNAQQALPSGGDIRIRTRPTQVQPGDDWCSRVVPGKYALLQVEDTGTGMDAETLARVFEPFFTTKQPGTGLGLASAYGIIRNHRGHIHADSEQGKGSVFTVLLPSTNEEPTRPPVAPTAVVSGSEAILVVDDEAVVLDVAAELLELAGYTVEKAASGHEAVARMRERRDAIRLVVLDMVMPGENVREIVASLRQAHGESRILLSSGYSQGDEANRLIEQGCCGFIEKPYTLTALSTKVREALDAKPSCA